MSNIIDLEIAAEDRRRQAAAAVGESRRRPKVSADLPDMPASQSGRGLQYPSRCLPGGAPVVRIYRPARGVMQAGCANARRWVLEFEPRSPRFVEPLMGWTGSSDTLQQVRIEFDSKRQAVSFAWRQGWRYRIVEPHRRLAKSRSYADNFLRLPRGPCAAPAAAAR